MLHVETLVIASMLHENIQHLLVDFQLNILSATSTVLIRKSHSCFKFTANKSIFFKRSAKYTQTSTLTIHKYKYLRNRFRAKHKGEKRRRKSYFHENKCGIKKELKKSFFFTSAESITNGIIF